MSTKMLWHFPCKPSGYLLMILLLSLADYVLSENDGCTSPAIIDSTQGTFFSPNYHIYPNQTYPNNLKCRWTINVAESKNIRLTFTRPMSIFGNTLANPIPCSNDWLAVFAGNRPSDVPVCGRAGMTAGPFCPPLHTPEGPEPMILAASSLDIEFCTDPTRGLQGFELTFEATDDPPNYPPPPTTPAPTPPPLNCSGYFFVSENEFFLDSPNYPNKYPPNVVCTWIITAPEGYGLTIDAHSFKLEEFSSPGVCDSRYDVLTMTDLTEAGEAHMGLYCDVYGPCTLKTTGNKMKLVFKSDGGTEESGFRLRIQKSICPLGSDVCPNTGADQPVVCLKPKELCDGIKQCPNGADEVCPLGCGVPASPPLLSTRNGARIVGGIAAKPHTWPWQISLLNYACLHVCGGTIIDHHWVMTAAHCCAGDQNSGPHTMKIRVGEHDLNNIFEKNTWNYDVERVFIHPDYDARSFANDICLLKTKQPIFFNKDVQPVCLGPSRSPSVGKDCYVTGWGSTGARAAPWSLRQVDVKITTREFCKAAYGGKLTEDMMCAYNAGKDSCQGDSGGPLVCQRERDPMTWELVGVVSWGTGCARPNVPGIYASTAHFSDWIAETIRG